jgi:hypothetical protein
VWHSLNVTGGAGGTSAVLHVGESIAVNAGGEPVGGTNTVVAKPEPVGHGISVALAAIGQEKNAAAAIIPSEQFVISSAVSGVAEGVHVVALRCDGLLYLGKLFDCNNVKQPQFTDADNVVVSSLHHTLKDLVVGLIDRAIAKLVVIRASLGNACEQLIGHGKFSVEDATIIQSTKKKNNTKNTNTISAYR